MLTTHHADARRSQMRARGLLRRGAAVLLAGVLTGCVADTAPGTETGASQNGASASATDQSAPASDGTAAEPAAGQPTAPVPKIVSLPPIELLGMSREDIVRNLGTPVFQRRDRTALLLRYRQGRCILDVYLYPRDPGGSARMVDYFEARNEDGQQIETKPCIDAVRKANGTG